MANSTILDIVFAFDVKPGDPRIEQAEEAIRTVNEIVTVGVYLGQPWFVRDRPKCSNLPAAVDIFPFRESWPLTSQMIT